MAGHILIADDDEGLTKAVTWYLEAEGYRVSARHDGKLAWETFEKEGADAVIIDVMMPGMDGFQLCRSIRQCSRVPILMLSARDAEVDKVQALNLGADDYVTKPFGPMELVARIKALLRRSSYVDGPTLKHGKLEIAREQRQVFVDGKEVELPLLEFELLAALVSRPQRVLTRDHLVSLVWNDFYGDERLVDAHIYRLRKRLQEAGLHPCPIVTVRGSGYAFRPED
ncbi:MAG TPA: response regulator transcription factor [Armatimonadota bacterium]|nr:response regulator transcription factor [Armatimonadota bacterium]